MVMDTWTHSIIFLCLRFYHVEEKIFLNAPVCVCVLPGLNVQDIIVIVLSLSVVVVTAIALIFYR